MPQLSNDKFLIIKNIKNYILGLEKLLITFPKKEKTNILCIKVRYK